MSPEYKIIVRRKLASDEEALEFAELVSNTVGVSNIELKRIIMGTKESNEEYSSLLKKEIEPPPFGKVVRLFMTLGNNNPKDFANKMGVSKHRLYQLVNSIGDVRPSTVERVVNAFGFQEDDWKTILLRQTGNRKSSENQ